MKKKRSICKWKKGEVMDNLALLKTIVANPCLACKKCDRVANEKDWLCKPVKL